MSLFEIQCPMCKGTLWIDPSNGRLVDHKSTEHKKLDLNNFVKSQKTRGADLENQFRKAKEEQLKRKEQMEKDFLRAKEHPEELPDTNDFQSPYKWD